MGVTASLCDKIVGVTSDRIPFEAFARADQIALDGIAVAVAGATDPGPRLLAAHVREQGGNPLAMVIGFGFKTSVFNAAYVNGASMHVLDYEPMSNPANHATSPTLPGLLALAQWRGFEGRELATALIKGIEMQGRLTWATGRLSRYRFHRPGIFGAIGAAVAAGHLLRLSSEQLRQAIAIAASRAAGLTANSGTMTKCTHCGLAAAHGLEAALLVERGFTANSDVIEHPRGFAQAYIGEPIDESSLLGYGEPFRFIDAGYAIKLFPCQYTTHWGIDAALQVRPRIVDLAGIRQVTVTIPHMINIEGSFPVQGLTGKFSVRYTVACALLDGYVGIDHFSDESLTRAALRSLFEKIRLAHDETRPGEAQDRWVDIEVETMEGERMRAQCLKPAGHYALPPISLERHRAKLHDCLSRALDPEAEEEMIRLAGSLSTLRRPQVARLIELAATPQLEQRQADVLSRARGASEN